MSMEAKPSDSQVYGAIEAGGTKFICAVGSGPEDIRDIITIPTRGPEETLSEALEFFRKHKKQAGTLSGIGIASFGPIDLNKNSGTYGYITSTPKPEWSDTDVIGRFRDFGVPIGFDTDVNGAGLAECLWGAGRGHDVVAYVTIGTGIGCGILHGGKPCHGDMHYEIGHIPIPHDMIKDPYPGRCPFHGDCLEGLASGPAIEDRWGHSLAQLPKSHPAIELEAVYLSYLCAMLIYAHAPGVIILGGGVMQAAGLMERIHEKMPGLLGGYASAALAAGDFSTYIVRPDLGDRAGILGALALAMKKGAL